ncbi:MAG: MBL fold metallo-hydrolase [Elusimicrobiota bacterium]
MKLLFMGTAAAEGWPALFCQCKHCESARKIGGKNVRARAGIKIGDKYLLDFSPDVFHFAMKYNFSFGDIQHLFITHAHNDHCQVEQLAYRVPPFAHLNDAQQKLVIHGNAQVMNKIKAVFSDTLLEKLNIVLDTLQPFKSFTAGELEVTAIAAKHGTTDPLNYVFKYKDRVTLIAFDTGWYNDETWEYLKKQKFDLVILDCTMQNLDLKMGMKACGHLGINTGLEVIAELKKFNTVREGSTRYIVTHFSHNGGMMYHELEAQLAPHDVIVAYDGMTVEI